MADLRASGLGGVPKGTTADRPASPSIGDVFYNGTLGVLEIYTSQGWVSNSAPPSIPETVVATNQGSGRAFNNGQASVAFNAGSGGGLTSSYQVIPSPSTTPSSFTGSSSPITVTGLQSSTQYTYEVKAINNFGSSSPSIPSAAVTATTIPQAPTIGTATDLQTGQNVSVAFTAGATGGSAVTSYTVTSSPGGLTASGSSSPITVTGLTTGTAYTFTVTATNANGTSAASAASNSATPTIFTFSADYLVVAGGGSGGSNNGGGGGGAGGLRSTVASTGGGGSVESSLTLARNFNYTFTVGAGGPAPAASSNLSGSQGSSSSLSGYGITTVSCNGGGAGGGQGSAGGNGGSGGGGGSQPYGTWAGGSKTNNQGYDGGSGTSDLDPKYLGGGGGGAGQAGSNAVLNSSAGNGGNGVTNSITGSSVQYAGGGGGGRDGRFAGAGGSAGSGGGGIGGSGGGGNAGSGNANTGGGGGGGTFTGGGFSNPGNGGSGIIVIKYPSANTINVGAGLTSSELSNSGGFRIHQFTAGTGTVSWS